MPPVVRELRDDEVLVAIPGGVWLPDGDVAQPRRTLALRPVDGQDEVFVLDSAETALPSERSTRLLARCLRDGHDFAHSLTVGDREALLLQLRRLTIGEKLECVLRCPAQTCGERMEFSIDVSALLVPAYPDVRSHYEATTSFGGGAYVVSFRLPSAGDLDGAAVLARTDPVEGARDILRRCVIRAERNGVPLDASGLPDEVRDAVGAAMAELDPQAEVELQLRCPACATSFATVFDTAAYFLRELEERAGRLLSEVNTLALHYHWSEADILRMSSHRRMAYLALLSETQARVRAR